MTKEELKKALGEAFAPINDRLEALEKAAKDPKADDKEKTDKADEEETALDAKAVAKAVSEAIAPINEKIEQLEKARVSNNHETSYQTNVAKAEVIPSYVDAAFPLD